MSPTMLPGVLILVLAFVLPVAAGAQSVPPVIHRVTLQADTGVLSIAGTGLGADLLVTLDGQPISVLPGATATEIDALVAPPMLATPGTYRLTLVDPVRHAGDAFVVAIAPAGGLATGSTPVDAGADAVIPATRPEEALEAAGVDRGRTPTRASVSPHLVEGPSNTAVGQNALASNTTGASNTATGVFALQANTNGNANTATGGKALFSNSSGGGNTATGATALMFNTLGGGNTAIGSYALSNNTSADFNSAVGTEALFSNSTGGSNTASGARTLYSNTTGSFNTASGAEALHVNTTGIRNTATGAFALRQNLGSQNTATGVSALYNNTAGNSNTASGYEALVLNTTGSFNTASGAFALYSNTTGDVNTASGRAAMYYNTSGIYNTASGVDALSANTSGNGNNAFGAAALVSNTTGSNSVAVGNSAGYNATTGSYNIYLGNNVPGTAADTHTMRLGLPYDSGTSAGQTRTFIAGIRGTSVAAGEAVFIDAAGQLGSGPLPALAANSVGSAHVIDDALTASDLAPGAVGPSELADNAVTAAKVAFNYAASTSEGGPALDVACTGCVAASEVGFTFASLGANAFTGTQALAAGNLDLSPSSATAGNLTKNGTRFLHNAGSQNTFLGVNAGTLAPAGSANTGLGTNAGANATTGSHNLFLGANVTGTAADTNTMRLGLPYDGATGAGQNQTFIAGVWGNPVTGTAAQVFVDANGRLGTGTPVAILNGTATLVTPAGVEQQLQEQQATIDELRTRLARLEEALVKAFAARR